MLNPATLLGPLDGLSAEEVNRRFAALIAGVEIGAAPALPNGAFADLVSEIYDGPFLFSFVDLLCGAGGSSIGLTMAGGRLLLGANHDEVVIRTHEANFRDANHECVDLDHYDMRSLPYGADILFAGVICTEVSPAGGKKRKNRGQHPHQEELLKYGPVKKQTFERTRATALDVIKAVEARRFPIVIVENVVEFVTDWELVGWWLDGMVALGYEWQLVCVSSAHVGDDTNPHAPQRRDRVYFVFNRKGIQKPDVEPHPMCRCEHCGDVYGNQWWKKPNGTLTESGRHFRVGKYGIKTGQYIYRCPNRVCGHSVVVPYERPAASVIDWSDLGVRICDRKTAGLRPLVPNTLRRIGRGFELYGRPTLVNSAHDDDRAYPPDGRPFPSATTKIGLGLASPFLVKNYSDRGRPGDRVRPVAQPFGAMTTGRNQGLVVPPGAFLDANGGSWNQGPASVHAPFRTRTTTEWEALAVPDGAFIDTARQHVVPTSVQAPFTTIAAGGNHHGLVVPYYTTGRAKPTSQPFDTVTTLDRFGLAQGGDGASLDDVMQSYYRMIQWYEQAHAQRFPASYIITGNDGERTAQAGNAVSCNVAAWLGRQCAKVLNRDGGR